MNMIQYERRIAKLVRFTFVLYLALSLLTVSFWLIGGMNTIDFDLGSPFRSGDYAFHLAFRFDGLSAVFLTLTASISNIIVFFSRRYLHRDPSYRRFFIILSLFTFGMTVIVCAGSFAVLFLGWEIVGFSSFMLISYYWHRPQAVLNAKRAYFIYRLCDLGLIAAALIKHGHTVPELSLQNQWILCCAILFAVLGKSAQFPFSYWLPRAMEGPTPSSAIFYGSLSIHTGVFLLLRTQDIWSTVPGFGWVLVGVGLLTTLSSTLSSRVQTNIKGQIGYASIAQVGLILIELGLGFSNLALLHCVGNAFLRCFQLLVSPSILVQRLQTHHALNGETFKPLGRLESYLPARWQDTLYVLAINDWFIEQLFRYLVLKPSTWVKDPLRLLWVLGICNLLVIAPLHGAQVYLAELGISWLLAYYTLAYVLRCRPIDSLGSFSGLLGQFPRAGNLCLLGLLGFIAFPVTAAFFAEDLIFHEALGLSWIWVALVGLVFVLNGICGVSLFSRVFLGKRNAEIPGPHMDFSMKKSLLLLASFLVVGVFPCFMK